MPPVHLMCLRQRRRSREVQCRQHPVLHRVAVLPWWHPGQHGAGMTSQQGERERLREIVAKVLLDYRYNRTRAVTPWDEVSDATKATYLIEADAVPDALDVAVIVGWRHAPNGVGPHKEADSCDLPPACGWLFRFAALNPPGREG